MERTPTVVSFDVHTLTETETVDVNGTTLGDLRSALKVQFGIPPFEQLIVYNPGNGEDVVLKGDDSVPIDEVPGLRSTPAMAVSRQVDPRFKMEKETAFCEALVACRFVEAKEMLDSSGFTIDPNCIHRGSAQARVAVTECPSRYCHPALTVALQAGLELVVHFMQPRVDKIEAFMSREDELCDLVQLMMERSADVNAVGDETQDCESAGCPNVSGKTPLCAAVQRGSPKLVRMLLDAKADPNHQHVYGQSAWGPDRNNPFGPGQLRPESWLSEISNGSVSRRSANDPRTRNAQAILDMLRTAPSV